MSRFHRNTWAIADDLIEKMMAGENGGQEHLRDLTAQFEAAYEVAALSELFEPLHFEENYPDPWSGYKASLHHGMPITPRISVAVTHCLEYYSSKGGGVSYEEVFHGGEVERVGNHAKATYKQNAYQEFHKLVTCVELSHVNDLSMTALAKHYVESTPGLGGSASFLRGYRRWRDVKYKQRTTA